MAADYRNVNVMAIEDLRLKASMIRQESDVSHTLAQDWRLHDKANCPLKN